MSKRKARGVQLDEYGERITYLGTGIGDLDAAKRDLRRRFNQGQAEQPVSRTGRLFYVTVRDGRRTGFLLGPYVSHMTALANVERGKRLTHEANSWAHFYAYGTASLPRAARRPNPVFGR